MATIYCHRFNFSPFTKLRMPIWHSFIAFIFFLIDFMCRMNFFFSSFLCSLTSVNFVAHSNSVQWLIIAFKLWNESDFVAAYCWWCARVVVILNFGIIWKPHDETTHRLLSVKPQWLKLVTRLWTQFGMACAFFFFFLFFCWPFRSWI